MTAPHTGRQPHRSASECPTCHRPTVDGPFCPHDGALLGEFVLDGRYTIEELLGQGGMGFVFGARHNVLGKSVAIKVLRPDFADDEDTQRFVREARNASRLGHENIVEIVDFGFERAHRLHYLVMERLGGRTLTDVMASEGPLPWTRVVPILLQLARALHAAHEAEVVHRDLKPGNIFLVSKSGRDDVVKLCDFGLSRRTDGTDRLTTTGSFLGTPAYMAPEQIRDGDAGAHVDLYALGVTAYELLSGELPYEASTPVALIASKVSDPPIPLSQQTGDASIPDELEALIMQCLSLDRDARPQSAEELESALLLLARQSSTELAATTPIIGQMAGRYRIVELVGSGGAGSVYLGEHPVLATKVAVKVLLPEFAAVPVMVKRFIKEAQTASSLGSPHIPHYFDFGYLRSGQPYAVMEYFDGESLHAYLGRSGPLSIEETVDLVTQVARTISQAHEAGIVHRDLKPENLFLVAGEDGPVIKLLDFGIAILTGPHKTGERMTTPGLMMGTPQYCAPEQAMGEEVGPAADIYALGVTAFEMLSGRCPFEGEPGELLATKVNRDAPRLGEVRADVPVAIASDIASMLAREPESRPPSMQAVVKMVAAWPEHQPSARTYEVAQPLSAAQRRLRFGLVLAGFAVLLFAVLFARGFRDGYEIPTSSELAAPPSAADKVTPPAARQVPAEPIIAPLETPEVVDKVERTKKPTRVRARARTKRSEEPKPAVRAKRPAPKERRPRAKKSSDIQIADPFKE